MKTEVRRVFQVKVYGVRKVWRQMQREGFDIARARACGASASIRSSKLFGPSIGLIF